MDTLEIGVSRIISGLHQCFKARLHQSAYAAAKDSLLAEQIGFGLGAEGGFKNACAGAADTQSISQSDFKRIACGVLLNSNKARNTLACLILTAHGVTGTFGRNHNDVDILRGLDAAEMNVESVSKSQSLALCEVRLDALLIELCLLFIVDKNHDKIGVGGSFGGGHNLQSLCLCLRPAL